MYNPPLMAKSITFTAGILLCSVVRRRHEILTDDHFPLFGVHQVSGIARYSMGRSSECGRIVTERNSH
jgi:hypothetical protein